MGKTKEEILDESLIGVNKESIKSHHHFLPGILSAMQEYADNQSSELTAENERLKEENADLKQRLELLIGGV